MAAFDIGVGRLGKLGYGNCSTISFDSMQKGYLANHAPQTRQLVALVPGVDPQARVVEHTVDDRPQAIRLDELHVTRKRHPKASDAMGFGQDLEHLPEVGRLGSVDGCVAGRDAFETSQVGHIQIGR